MGCFYVTLVTMSNYTVYLCILVLFHSILINLSVRLLYTFLLSSSSRRLSNDQWYSVHPASSSGGSGHRALWRTCLRHWSLRKAF